MSSIILVTGRVTADPVIQQGRTTGTEYIMAVNSFYCRFATLKFISAIFNCYNSYYFLWL